MEDSFFSLQEFDIDQAAGSSQSTRTNKILTRGRNTVSLSALSREESYFHKEIAEALEKVYQSNSNLSEHFSSTERFKRFVDGLSRTRSCPAVYLSNKLGNQRAARETNRDTVNVSWSGLDDWTKMLIMTLLISLFMAFMQSFGIL